MSYPATPFGHLRRLTDNIGLIQHADGTAPLHGDGYNVDDSARGLLVICREPSPSQELVVLGRRYLYFLAQAQALGGKFRNHLGYDRRWHDQPGTGDGWGCSLWALGTAATRGPTPGIREESFTRFNRGARVSSPAAPAMAFAALGAAEVLDSHPGHAGALALLYRASIVIGEPPENAVWPWPAPRLGAANAAIAEAVIVSGRHLGNDRMLRNGLRMLEWLLATETKDGHLSVISPLGWGPGLNRFSDPTGKLFGVVYLGSSLKVCFVETILRNRVDGLLEALPIARSELDLWVAAEIRVRKLLTLVDLRGDGRL